MLVFSAGWRGGSPAFGPFGGEANQTDSETSRIPWHSSGRPVQAQSLSLL